MLKLDQIKIDIKENNEASFKKEVSNFLNIKQEQISQIKILKRSVDARRKDKVKWVYSFGVSLIDKLEEKFKEYQYQEDFSLFEYEKKSCEKNPIVVGFGPAGMFCALALARMGLCPVVLEQGKSVDERQKDVLDFWNNKKLNKYSNVQFGEGGAGTFSDGKLNTNLNSDICKKIINEFYHFGADKDILLNTKPHIGSDKLQSIVKNIRNEIISFGGKILFSHKLEKINIQNKKLKSIIAENLSNGEKIELITNHLILALGHSARDTFEMLKNNGFEIKQKPFAMGVRIEQNQEMINIAQYGKDNAKYLPNADYKLVTHLPNGRSVFTFCMCPGGYVVASSSNEGEIVTNGMSNFARDNESCNSALLVNVIPEDYQSDDVLAGIYFQQKYEKLSFELGGKNYCAPCETVGSFLNNDKNIIQNVKPTYKPNVTFAKIEKCLPDFVCESLKLGLVALDKKLAGFANSKNLLIAVESRSSCPLTIVRDENFESNISGVYPVGEGAGYAGGIVSSAQDGIKTAESIYKKL